MKKLSIIVSDLEFEKIMYESLISLKSVNAIVRERIFEKPFSASVEEKIEKKFEQELKKIMKD